MSIYLMIKKYSPWKFAKLTFFTFTNSIIIYSTIIFYYYNSLNI